jgi:hypothetical protein
MFLLSAFCQNPVEGFKNGPIGGTGPILISRRRMSAIVATIEIAALINFMENVYLAKISKSGLNLNDILKVN